MQEHRAAGWWRSSPPSRALSVRGAALAQAPIVIKFSHVVATTRPRARPPNSSPSGRRAAPRARSRSRSTRTASSTRTRRRWRRCSSARCRCSRRRWPSSARSACKEFEVFDLPFIFDNTAELHKVTQGPVGKQLLKKLEPRASTAWRYWDNGFKVVIGQQGAAGRRTTSRA